MESNTMKSNCHITRLSLDLFMEIFDTLDATPAEMVSFACTCKAIAQLLEPSFARHREAHRQYRYTSDLDPSTFPSLARSLIFGYEPLVAKYLRSIDIWGTRSSRAEAKRYDVDEAGVHLIGDVATIKPFDDKEMEQLLELTQNILGDSELDRAREELAAGGDGLLQLLVIASCPNLETLKFVRRRDCLLAGSQYWLYKAIVNLCKSGKEFPIGLRKLGDLAIGVDAGIQDGEINVIEQNLRHEWEGTHEFGTYLKLPNLDSIYYGSEVIMRQDYEGPPMSMEGHRSNVKHIFLDVKDQLCHYATEEIWRAPLALETLAVRLKDAHLQDSGDLPKSVSQESGHSLEKLMIYYPESMEGYQSEHYLPDELECFEKIGMWYQHIHDINLQSLCEIDNGEDRDPTLQIFTETFLQWLHPETTEVLMLNGDPIGDFLEDGADYWAWLDEALCVYMTEASQHKLKAIFLTFTLGEEEHNAKVPSVSVPRAREMIAGAIKRAQELGVDLYTWAGGRDDVPKRHALKFPAPVTKWDLGTGKSFGKRVEDGYVAFDPIHGEWKKAPEKDEAYYMEPEEWNAWMERDVIGED